MILVCALMPVGGAIISSPGLAQGCVDYGEYMHWVGGAPIPFPSISFAVAVEDGYAYVAAQDSGLLIFDVSDPSAPVLAASVDTPGLAMGVAVAASRAYVADDAAGLQVIDVSSPTSPSLMGVVNTPGRAWDVAISGSHAYVADRLGGLQVVDLSSLAIVG